MSVSFNDIRAACQSAQSRIMRLQQATNNQVGLTSSIREGWFEELRSVAQCFITAQQAGAKLEQSVNTERAQLQGSLSAALNERDLRASERDAAEQEVNFLRGRLNELGKQLQAQKHAANNRKFRHETPANRDSWVLTGGDSGASFNGDSPEMVGYAEPPTADILKQLPHTIEDMPFSPQKKDGIQNQISDIAPLDLNQAAGSGNSLPFRSNTPRFTNRGYRNNQSKFFTKPGGPFIQRNQSSCAGSSGNSTPEFIGGASVGPFALTPGGGHHGPFTPPPLPHQPSHRHNYNAQGGNILAPTASPFEPSSRLAPPPLQQTENNQKNVQHIPLTAPSRPQTPASGKELALVRDDEDHPGEFAPGVPPQRGTTDEERVCDIFQFFNAIKSWVEKYCSIPNIDAMHNLSHQHPRLWDYACSVTYPNNRHNASSHSLFMLCNKSFRTYFITRLVIQYVVQQMWSPQAWEGLDEKLTDVLVSVKHRLDLKYGYDAVLQPHERHGLVEKRSRAIYDFMRQPNWNKCKAAKINQATNRFKDIVGPMMNMERVDHKSAGHELNGICESALRLSAILNTCRLSFQFLFNECGIKFSDQSHRPLNSTIPARELQAHHWRLMCVVTPGITYRNDAGISVDPRFLAKANVLLMQ